MDKPSQEQIEIMRQYWKSIYNKAAPILHNYTIPIYYNAGNQLKHHGTGVLIEDTSNYFLVSAAHVLEINTNNKIVIAINDNIAKPINKIAKLTPHIEDLKDRTLDKIDIAVVKFFDSEILDELIKSKVFLKLSNLIEHHKDSLDLPNYIAFGYPEFGVTIDVANSYTTIESKIMILPTKISSFKKFDKYNCNPYDHIFVEYFKNMTISDGSKSLNKIKPHGISGCGLWYIDPDILQKENKIKLFLVGVVTEYQDKYHRVLIATKVHHVVNLMKAHIELGDSNISY